MVQVLCCCCCGIDDIVESRLTELLCVLLRSCAIRGVNVWRVLIMKSIIVQWSTPLGGIVAINSIAYLRNASGKPNQHKYYIPPALLHPLPTSIFVCIEVDYYYSYYYCCSLCINNVKQISPCNGSNRQETNCANKEESPHRNNRV